MALLFRLFEPLTVALLVLVALACRARPRRPLFLGAVGVLVVVSHPLTAWLMVGLLEWQHPARANVPSDLQAVVILSGYDFAPDSSLRTLAGFEVHQRVPGVPVFVTGSREAGRPDAPPDGERMRDLLVELGVPATQIIVDTQARTTFENGQQAVRALAPLGIRRIGLVTEAVHMPRSARVFRALGFDVVPFGCYYRTQRFPEMPQGLLPNASAAFAVQRALHEWMGLAWYWVSGRL